jgi:DNA invertase Pin-like site-specific DNA recombinase
VNVEIHIHIHHHPDSTIVTKLDRIISNQGVMMAKVDDLKAELVEINTTTDEIASDIADLMSRIAGGLSAAEAEEVNAQLTALKDKLKSVASTHTPSSPTP